MALAKYSFEYLTLSPANDFIDPSNFARRPLLKVHLGSSRTAITQLDIMIKMPEPQRLAARIIYVLAIDYL